MTDIVFKPEKAKIENGRGLYRAYMNRKPLDLLFRARTAGEADAMLQYLFTEQTKGKTLFVDQELFEQNKEKDNDNREKEKDEAGDQEAAEGAGSSCTAPGPVSGT